MTSTFRLIKAEFKKIFKKPSVYIMALFLVVTVLLSVYTFKPESIDNGTITYGENLNSENYYDTFYNQNLAKSKSGIDELYTDTDTISLYYIKSNARDHNLNEYYDSIINSINAIRNTTDQQLKDTKYAELKNNVNNFYDAYSNFSDLSDYDHITATADLDYYKTTLTKSITSFIEDTEKYNSTKIIEAWDNNNYENEFKKCLNYATNFINPTLYSMSMNIKDTYTKFSTAHEGGAHYLINLEVYRKQLENQTYQLKTYFDNILNSDYPLILINSEKANEITSKLDDSYQAISAFHHNEGETSSFSKYNELNDKLIRMNYANYFSNTFALNSSPVHQVKIDNSLLDIFEKVKIKVNKNREEILTEINELKTDTAVSNIQFKISEYSLLSKSYSEYLNDSVIINLSEKFDSDTFSKMFGDKYKYFNKYQYQERITKNTYYIDSNLYSNSFATNLTFAQNSTNETNVYDFMYFTMEFCSIIILVFAMLLICGLVAGETDSGTIKLLLVRPFKRSKVLTAKLMATIYFVITFMIFSGLISFAAGYYTFGLSTTPILSVINSTQVAVMSPLALIGIDILCLTLEILFYVFVALMIATICRNHSGSIYICLVIVILVYTMNILFSSSFWYSFLPGMNLHLFKYFGNSFTGIAAPSFIQNLLITPIQSTMSLLYSSILNLLYILIAIATAYAVFNKRDF